VNECRKGLFSKKNRIIESIPPTEGALLQHALRASYQGGHIWGQSTVANAQLPDPCQFGWTKDGDVLKPLWTTLSSASVHCSELISCGCKTACRGLCKCFRAELPCTSLCACDGECFSEDTEVTTEEVEEDCEFDNIVDVIFDDCDDE
jgi:hypothetical protein